MAGFKPNDKGKDMPMKGKKPPMKGKGPPMKGKGVGKGPIPPDQLSGMASSLKGMR